MIEAAYCVLDNSKPEPCQVEFASDETMLAIGFFTPYGPIMVAGPPKNETTMQIVILDFNGTEVPATGQCKVSVRFIECEVITVAVKFTISAVNLEQ